MSKPGKIVVIYHENWLLRKEGVTQWIEYWGVIRGRWLQFYEKGVNNRPELRRTLEITPNTKCSLVKRNKSRYPFSVDNGNGVYYLKVETELERYHWILSILTAALGRPKKALPTVVPPSMKETETFRKLTKAEKQEIRDKRPPPPKKEHVPAADIKNKRRRKYAVRRENKIKKKERARKKKMGLDPDEEESEESEDDQNENETTPVQVSNRRTGNENRLSSVNSTVNLQQQQRNKNMLDVRDRQREQVLGSSPSIIKASSLNKEESAVTVKAMVHPPSAGNNKESSYTNQAFSGDDVEDQPKIPVVLNDDGLLPNMVFTEVSDSDEETTEEVSLNSQTDFLSLESDLIPTDGAPAKNDHTQGGGRSTITSRTVLSDNGDVVQFSTSPDMSKNRANKQRPSSAHITPNTLLERPISPLLAQPLLPYKKTNSRPGSPYKQMETEPPTFLADSSTV